MMMRKLLLPFLLSIAAFAQNSTPNPGALTASGSTCTPTDCTSVVLPPNASSAAISLSGTFSATVQFEVSADGSNFVSANAAPQPSGAVVTSATGTGTWTIPVAGMMVLRARVSSYASGTVVPFINLSAEPFIAAQNTTGVTIANTAGTTDPCQNPSVLKTNVAINITSAATTSLVAVSGSTAVYVCGFSFSISQVVTTANTLQFEYGTGASCTGTHALTGLYGAGGVTAGIPIVVSQSGPGTVFTAPASNGLCAVTAIGASGSFQGQLTYVQQ